jgi:hypothetical protein
MQQMQLLWSKDHAKTCSGQIYIVVFIQYILITVFHFFNRQYRSTFYTGTWVQRMFCKVSKNLKFRMNKIFKEHITNYATFLNNPSKCRSLVFVIKSNLTVITR